MKPLKLLTLSICALATTTFAAPNLVVNPSFEDPITSDGPPFVGFWEGFSGGPGSSAANSTAFPRTGAQNLTLSIVNTANTFAGVFQDITGLLAGTQLTFAGYNATPSNPLDLIVEFRIEWRNSGSNTEISRTLNSNPVPGPTYSPFSLTAAVPVGADTARIVYAIQTFGGGPTHNGIVYVDDVSLTVVPEPSTAALMGIGGLALLVIRRRRARA